MEKLDRESAQREFDRFAEEWDLETDLGAMEDEDRKSYEAQRDRLLKAIRSGALTIGDGGIPTFTPKHAPCEGTPLTLKVPTGSTYMSMDRFKDRQAVHKMHAVLAEMTEQVPKFFSSMDARDLKVPQAVLILFLAS